MVEGASRSFHVKEKCGKRTLIFLDKFGQKDDKQMFSENVREIAESQKEQENSQEVLERELVLPKDQVQEEKLGEVFIAR